MEFEFLKKFEIVDDVKEENEEEVEGSKGEYFIFSVLIDYVVLSFCIFNLIIY